MSLHGLHTHVCISFPGLPIPICFPFQGFVPLLFLMSSSSVVIRQRPRKGARDVNLCYHHSLKISLFFKDFYTPLPKTSQRSLTHYQLELTPFEALSAPSESFPALLEALPALSTPLYKYSPTPMKIFPAPCKLSDLPEPMKTQGGCVRKDEQYHYLNTKRRHRANNGQQWYCSRYLPRNNFAN